MIRFVFPTAEHSEDVLSFYREFDENNERCIGFDDRKDYEKWQTNKIDRLCGTNLPEGYVPEIFVLCYDDTEMVGVFSLKLKMTEYLTNYGGHIGYAVKPSARNRGYATEILKNGLILSKLHGFKKVLAVCDDDNTASEKVIIKNGGKYINTLFDEAENTAVKRYIIEV